MRVYHPQPVKLSGSVSKIAPGKRGIFQTVRMMRALVLDGRQDPFVVDCTRAMCLMCPKKDRLAQARAVFEFCRDHVWYVSDPVDVECISPAWYTLHTRSGDCDDKSILLASMLEAIGIQTAFVVAGYQDPSEFEHVYVSCMPYDGDWRDMDPTEDMPFGWSAPDPVALWVES